MQPLLRDWEGFVVMLSRACRGFGETKVIICDIWCELQWYLVAIKGLSDFFKKVIEK